MAYVGDLLVNTDAKTAKKSNLTNLLGRYNLKTIWVKTDKIIQNVPLSLGLKCHLGLIFESKYEKLF